MQSTMHSLTTDCAMIDNREFQEAYSQARKRKEVDNVLTIEGIIFCASNRIGLQLPKLC